MTFPRPVFRSIPDSLAWPALLCAAFVPVAPARASGLRVAVTPLLSLSTWTLLPLAYGPVPTSGLVPPPKPVPPSGPIPVIVKADSMEGDATHVRGAGRAQITSEQRRIEADEVAFNYQTHDVTADGTVVVTGDGRRIAGKRANGNLQTRKISVDGDVRYTTVLVVPNREVGPRALPLEVHAAHIDYDMAGHTGTATDVKTEALGFHFQGRSGTLLPNGRVELVGADFSACPLGESGRFGYHLRAKSVDLVPQKGATANRATLFIGRHRITTVSRFHMHPGGSETPSGLTLPSVGQTPLAGTFLRWAFQPSLFGAVTVDSRIDLTSKLGLRTFTTARASGGGPNPFLRVNLNEEVLGRNPARLLIDRLPELGFLLDGDSNTRLNRWVMGDASVGYIEQKKPGRRTGRAQFTLLSQPIKLKDRGAWRLSARPGIHLASYSTGDSYRDLSAEIAVSRRWNARHMARFGFAKHFSGGTTPFLFDEALVPNELFAEYHWTAGPWGFGVGTRYDAKSGNLFDAKFSVGHVTRCVEPRLVYRYRLREISVELNLVGLGNTEDLPPAGSVPPPSVAGEEAACKGCMASDDAGGVGR